MKRRTSRQLALQLSLFSQPAQCAGKSLLERVDGDLRYIIRVEQRLTRLRLDPEARAFGGLRFEAEYDARDAA